MYNDGQRNEGKNTYALEPKEEDRYAFITHLNAINYDS